MAAGFGSLPSEHPGALLLHSEIEIHFINTLLFGIAKVT